MDKGLKCGLCGHPIGKGKGFKTGAEVKNATVTLTDIRVPQLQNLPVVATFHICIVCATGIADQMHSAQGAAMVGTH